MLHNPRYSIVETRRPADYSAISRMFADWCKRQGAQTEIEYEDGVKYVHATRGDWDNGIPYRGVSAAFDAFDGRFLRDGSVATECEFGSATTLIELANALRTGHRDGKGHR